MLVFGKEELCEEEVARAEAGFCELGVGMIEADAKKKIENETAVKVAAEVAAKELEEFRLWKQDEAKENNAIVAINGFTWAEGSDTTLFISGRHWAFDYNEGTWFKNIEYAKPMGTTVFRNRTLSSVPILNPNSRSLISLEIPTGGTPKVHSWQDSFIDESQFNPYNNLYTSSTTILHNGNCNPIVNFSSRGTEDKWSAIGVKDGKMLMISSNHASKIKTNTYEMCQIFKAFGYDEAIRQDGGSATSMVLGGTLLNPLVGAERTAMQGDARNILYAITARVVE